MKWIKITPNTQMPSEDILVTDGEYIGAQLRNMRISNNPKMITRDWTHYALVKDLELPSEHRD